MSARVVVYQVRDHHRSRVTCEAMVRGIRRAGDSVAHLWEHDYTEPVADVAVFYGLEGRLPRVFRDYRRAGLRAVYIDLGYWGRRAGGRWSGFHKICVNSRHPTEYFQSRRHDDSRARVHALTLAPWRADGRHILLAGMGDKAARVEGMPTEAWERDAIRSLKRYTSRPILYRPKPSWKTARPIRDLGVEYSSPKDDVSRALANAWAVVTHHSNVAVDGLIAGIPAFCWEGVAAGLAGRELADIESPLFAEGREQWVNDVSWCQWSVAEMADGLPWRHLQNEGLVA
jgi:hypothetical protein